MQVPVHNTAGQIIEQIEISDHVFGIPANEAVVHQAMVSQMANARHGNANAKHRGEVQGSGRKLYAQKHTGGARAGDIRSPLRKGGGIVFGPRTRSYRQALPKKMRQLAIRSVLSGKMKGEQIILIDDFGLEKPKTKDMTKILTNLGIFSSALIITLQPDENVIKSARNIPATKTMPASLINVVDMLSYKMVLMTVAAVRKAEELWGEKSTEGGSSATIRGIPPATGN